MTSARTWNERRRWWLVLGVVWLLSAGYAGHLLMRGWVPHDEGTFGECAVRILAGQMPHRDFDDVYTGGLSYLHALAFHLLGTRSTSLRVVLFAVFLAWVPALYMIASRFVSTLTAAGVTLLAVAWSIPMYSASVPSWYNLFLATFGVAAVLHNLDTGSRWALFIAGVFGGLSFVVKSTGLFYVGAVVMFLAFRARCVPEARPAGAGSPAWGYRVAVTSGLLLVVAAVFVLVRSRGVTALVQYVLPAGALVAVIVDGEWRGASETSPRRFATLASLLLPFGAGFALPVVGFGAFYAAHGALGVLINGVFILPTKRLSSSSMDLPPLRSGLPIASFLLALGGAMGPRPRRRVVGVAAAAGLAAVLVLLQSDRRVYAFAWHALDLLPPIAVVAGAILVRRRTERALAGDSRPQAVMLVLCVAALCNLIRFPFAAPIYYCYALPLVFLAVVAVLSAIDDPPRTLFAALLGFYLLFAVLVLTPGFIYAMGAFAQRDPQTRTLTLARSGPLRVNPAQAEDYERLIPLVREHAGGSDSTFATPDCPEVYFLSALRSMRRTMFDFFDDPVGRKEAILDEIERHGIKVIVICSQQEFSGRDRDLDAALAERFPESATVGRFEVRWRP
jgi:hypothetical protein